MKLKTAVQDINEVPEALREYYTQVGDEYVLDADDKDYKGRINEFRTNNINLANRIKEMDSKFKDIDPEKWEEAQAALKKLQRTGIVSEVTGRKRARKFAYSDYLGILSEGTELT